VVTLFLVVMLASGLVNMPGMCLFHFFTHGT